MRKRQLIKRAVVIALAASIVIISLVYLFFSFGRPYMGIVLEYRDGGWVIETLDQNGAAWQAGARSGDRVIVTDGIPAKLKLARYEESGAGSLRFREIMLISNGGKVLHINLPADPSWPVVIEHLGYLCVSIIFLVTGIYVQLKKPGDVAATLLFWCGPLLLLGLSTTAAAQAGFESAILVSIAAITLGPWPLVHFFLVLPQERTVLRRGGLTYLIYLPAVVIVALVPFLGYVDGQPDIGFRTVRFIVIGIGFLAIAVVALVNYLRRSSNRTRQQMKIILVASMLGVLPIVILSLLPQVFKYHSIIPSGLTIIFLAFIPLGIGYAMVTRRLMNIDLVIRKGIIKAIITLILAAILAVTLALVIPTGDNVFATTQRIIFYLFIGILAAGLYGVLRNSIGNFLDRHMYGTRYDIKRTVDNLNKNMSTMTDFQEISRVIVATIANTIEPLGIGLCVKSRYGSYEVAATQGIFSEIAYRRMLMEMDAQRDPLVEFPNLASSVHPDIEFIVPLKGMQEETGVLYISRKVSGEQYSVDDMYLLQEIMDGAAASLERTLLIRDVSMRDTFVSIASHEMRSPLTAIMGYTDLLKEKEPPAELRRLWVQRIAECNQLLSGIVDELLNVSRIQSGRTILKLEPVSTSELLRTLVSIHAPVTDMHRFVLNIREGTPDMLAEYGKIRQVLDNLVGNAIKYSPGGGTITVTAWYDGPQHRVTVSVADEGIGIGQEDRLSLFTTFHRIQRPETQGIPGTGLGLYIVKKWVEAMNGKVWLESELNKGSVFFVAIPAAGGCPTCTTGGIPDEEDPARGR